MFRCHFTRGQRIVWGTELEATTLADAANEAAALLTDRNDRNFTGYEIWAGCECLFRSTCIADGSVMLTNFAETIPVL